MFTSINARQHQSCNILPKLINTALALLFSFPATVQADPFDIYLEGKGKYSCFKPKLSKNCGPRPSVLSQTGRYALHALDIATRRINDRSMKDKAILILSPLFAQIPATQALVEAQASELKKDVMRSFIIAYYREAKHLPPDIRVKRQNAMIKFLTNYDYKKPAEAKKKFMEAMGGAWALNASFSDIANVSLEDLKKAWKVYQDFQSAKDKAIDAAESWLGFASRMITMTDYIKADHHYDQAKFALDACTFDQAAERLRLAEQSQREFCRVASHEYRYAEMYADCYSEWYIDYMWDYNRAFDQNPQQTRLKNLHNDFKNNQGSLLNMLKLFGKIDERKEQLQKARESWQKATQLANQQKPIFDHALKNGDYKSACDIAYRLWGTAKMLPPNLECATRFETQMEINWIDRLNRDVYEETDKSESLLKQARSQIAKCKLNDAEQTLRQVKKKTDSLWKLEENHCQQSSDRDSIMQKIADLDKNLSQAKATVCSDKENTLNKGVYSATCIFKSKTKAGLEIGRRSITASSKQEMDAMIRQHCTTNDFHVTVQYQGEKPVHRATCIFLSKTKKDLEIGRRSVSASSKQEMDAMIRQHCTTNDFHVKIQTD